MNHQHVVSILVPIYNAETYLSQCIESILGQTCANLQVILIDDGSIDNSYAICKEYVKLDTRVELYHQENQGVAITRNNLLEKVRGDYVLFIDADDWVEPDMVEFCKTSLCLDFVIDNSVKRVSFATSFKVGGWSIQMSKKRCIRVDRNIRFCLCKRTI